MVKRPNVEEAAIRKRIAFADTDIDQIVDIIRRTGDLAPERELVKMFNLRQLSQPTLTYFLPGVWTGRKAHNQVPVETWRAMFESIEFTEDGVVQPRPRRSVRAYRGAIEAHREGLSWSLDRRQAEHFARDRQEQGGPAGRVWVTNIPASRVLAHVLEGWEKEVVADVRGLRILPIDEETQLPTPRWWWRQG